MRAFSEFASTIKTHGVAKASHFVIDLSPPMFMTGDKSLETAMTMVPFYVESVNSPELALLTQTVKDRGVNREVVYDKAYGSITATFFSDQNMVIKQFFDDWVASTVVTYGGKFMYPHKYISESMHLFVVNSGKKDVYMIKVNNVYPKIVDDIQLNSSSGGPMSFRVVFTFESWESYQYGEVLKPIGASSISGLRQIMDVVSLIRSGADIKAIRSSVIGLGAKKILDAIGQSKSTAFNDTVNSAVNSTGIGTVIGGLRGFGL